MRKTLAWRWACGLTASVILSAGFASAQETIKIKGLIVGRNGATMVIRGDTGNVNVTLSENTKVEALKGKFGLRKDALGATALIPGLRVEVDAENGAGGQMMADTVKFKADDLKTAHEIQAGLMPTTQQLQTTQQQVQANQQQIQANQQGVQKVEGDQAALTKRFSELSDYDVKGQATAYFAVNSTELSAQSKQELKSLATNALSLNGYMIQVAGFTDASGNAAYNQELSDRRAQAVIEYLQQSCGIALFRVLAPAAMGTSNPAASNETQQGKAENRRVVVKVLVNRGVAG
jgi:OOP family OmpA-OmpF porin